MEGFEERQPYADRTIAGLSVGTTLSRTRRTLFHVTENVEDLFFLDDRYQLFDLSDKYGRRRHAHPRNESYSQPNVSGPI